MPSEEWFGPPATEPGILQERDEQAPEIGGPPRRTSPKTLIIVFFSVVVFLVVIIPQMLASPSESTGSASGDTSSGLSLLFTLGPLLVVTLVAVAGWVARTYVVGADELVIDEGVFQRRRRVVPYGRVQQIDIDQRLLAQIFRLGTLTIETAGTAGGKAKLGMLDIRLARGIRRYALARRSEIQGATGAPRSPADHTASGPAPAGSIPPAWGGQPRPSGAAPVSDGLATVPSPPPWLGPVSGQPPPERILVRLGAGKLAVAGFTHHFVVSIVPAILLAGLVVGAFAVPANKGVPHLVVLGIAVGISALVAGAVATLVLVQYVVGQYGYTLAEQGDDLHLRFGLLQVRNVTIPRRRVQHITVSDNPLRRVLGIVGVQLHSAAPMGRQSGSAGTVHFEIPILRRAELDGFLHALMGGDWHVPSLRQRTSAARRRAVTRRVGLLALILVLPAAAFPPGSFALLIVSVIGVPWGLVAHQRAGYAEAPEVVVLARGVLHHRIDLLPYSRVQSASVVQNPFQRISGLRTLHVNVAGRSADPRLSDMPEVAALAFARDLPRVSVIRVGPADSRCDRFEAPGGAF